MSKQIGDKAERAVADCLKRQGLKIEARNWKAPGVEVDIVAGDKHRVLIVEVKYRYSATSGDGLDAIGRNKIKKLEYAAMLWQQHDKTDRSIELMAAAVDSLMKIEFRLIV